MRDYDAATSGSPTRYYYTFDPNYHVTAAATTAGAAAERYYYSPFGSLIFLDGSFNVLTTQQSQIGNSVTFTGRQLDSETGLYHFRNRYYHGQLAVFSTRDFAGYVNGPSLYRPYFAPNGLDPDGLETPSCQNVPDPPDPYGTMSTMRMNGNVNRNTAYYLGQILRGGLVDIGNGNAGRHLAKRALGSTQLTTGLEDFNGTVPEYYLFGSAMVGELTGSKQFFEGAFGRDGSTRADVEGTDRFLRLIGGGAGTFLTVVGGARMLEVPESPTAFVPESGPSWPIHIDIGGEGHFPRAINVNPLTTTTTTGVAGRPIPNLVRAVGEHLPFADQVADIVTIESVPISPVTASEIARVVAGGGEIRLVSPAQYATTAHARVINSLPPGARVMQTVEGTGETAVTTTIITLPTGRP
jgi:RHS repeat-associated protein